jgi:tRNA(Ile)-lysidine synthase
MNSVDEAIKKMLSELPHHKTYWVAYSGGVDSHVLLHALVKVKSASFQVRALHIHHGLQAKADAWCEHCTEQARLLDIPVKIILVDAKPLKGNSPEATARAARYGAFSGVIQADEVLLTAHNQNDQAETLLLQLMRGAGVKGLAAMPKSTVFFEGILYRPLLGVSRAQILDYATQAGLQWVEDPSNENTDFDRNFLRQKILPLMAERWPSFAQTVSRSALHCAEASAVVDSLAREDFIVLFNEKNNTLAIAELLKLSVLRQANVLRHWIAQQDLPAPSTAHLDCLLRDGVHAAEDKRPLVEWPGVQVRRFKGFLFAMSPLSDFDSSVEIVWDRCGSLVLPGNLGVVEPDDSRFVGGVLSTVEGPVCIRFRRGGEVMRMAGREGRHELKKLFQEWGVLPWRRDRVPLVYVEGELMAVLLSSIDWVNPIK